MPRCPSSFRGATPRLSESCGKRLGIMRSMRPRSLISGNSQFPRLLDPEFRARAPNYVFQCGLATAFLIAILLLENAVLRAVIVVAVASSAATIFVVPNSVAATPRRVVGGHVVAVVLGGAFSPVAGVPGESTYLVDVMAALSVRTEHPGYGVDGYRAPAGRRNSAWTRDLRLEPVRRLIHPLQRDRPIAPQGRAPPQAHKPALSGRRESPERPTLASNGGNPV